MTGTQTVLLGFLVGAIGAITLAIPGGWDVLSGLNLFMGGLLIGLGLAARWRGY